MTDKKSIHPQHRVTRQAARKPKDQEPFEPDTSLAALAQHARSNPASLTSDHMVRLQRAIGNRATIGLTQIQRDPDRMIDAANEKILEEMREKERARQELYKKAAAAPLRTLDDLLILVKRVEAAYPGEDWKGITTRIRKSYYDGFLWDSMIKDREDYPGLAWPPLAVEDYKAFTEAKKSPELAINGQSVDIGHVFTGLDAMNFTNTGTVMWSEGIQGPPGATWAGDVGSALAVWDVETDGDAAKRENYYNTYASSDDMLGDVDGIAIKLMPKGGEKDMGGNNLSDRLRWYYSSVGGATMRYTNFCAAAGFTWTGRGSGIAMDTASRAVIRSQIIKFGKAFRLKSGGVPGANWFYDADVDWFVDKFINWVAAGLAKENP